MKISSRHSKQLLGIALVICGALGFLYFRTPELEIVRGPYLQMPSSEGITIRWRSSVGASGSIRYGGSRESLEFLARADRKGNDFFVRLAGLKPSTTYYYRATVMRENVAVGSVTSKFHTAPRTGSHKAVRVWVLGDSGTSDANAASVRDAYQVWTAGRPADLMLLLGDNAYRHGTDAEYQKAFFDMYSTILRSTPVYSALGNHDGHAANSSRQSGLYFEIFEFPTAAEAGGVPSLTEAFYSFNYGNTHFVVLDSYGWHQTYDSAMIKWLESDLRESRQDWLVALWHHPPYSKGSHDSDSGERLIAMRSVVVPILEEHCADLVLSGHSHSYERSYLVANHYAASADFRPEMMIDAGSGRTAEHASYQKSETCDGKGTVYAVVGSSGETKRGRFGHPVMYISAAELGSMLIDVQANHLSGRFLTAEGSIIDEFSIYKTARHSEKATLSEPDKS